MQSWHSGLEKRPQTEGELAPLLSNPATTFTAFPGLHCSTYWLEVILMPVLATLDNTNEGFVTPECAFSQEVRIVEGGWGGEKV